MCYAKERNTHVNQPYTIKWMLKQSPSTARQNLQQTSNLHQKFWTIALVALIVISIFRSRIVESIILGSAVMDGYKFVNPSTPPACVKAYSLPPAYPNQINFQPPTLPQNWGDKGAEGKQKLAAQMTAWITTILIILTLLAILYTIFKKCHYVSSLPRVCFPLYPFSTIL